MGVIGILGLLGEIVFTPGMVVCISCYFLVSLKLISFLVTQEERERERGGGRERQREGEREGGEK